MNAIGTFLTTKFGLLTGGILGAWAIQLAIKFAIPYLVSHFLGPQLEHLININNEDDKALVVALIKWADAKIPGDGSGQQKADLVAEKLIAIAPVLASNRAKLADLIERVFISVKAELEKNKPS